MPYLKPTAPIASAALLPSDPAAALALAQDLLDAPRMSNHSHGLWGYHGETESAGPLTIQATGIGGPSAAIVLRELSELGVRSAIRVGSSAPGDSVLPPGALLVVERALAGDGTSAALGAGRSTAADRVLTRELERAAGPDARTGAVVSVDLAPDGRVPPPGELPADLESAALFALGERLGLAVGSVLAGGDGEEVALRAGRIAAAALASAQEGSPPRPGMVSRS